MIQCGTLPFLVRASDKKENLRVLVLCVSGRYLKIIFKDKEKGKTLCIVVVECEQPPPLDTQPEEKEVLNHHRNGKF